MLVKEHCVHCYQALLDPHNDPAQSMLYNQATQYLHTSRKPLFVRRPLYVNSWIHCVLPSCVFIVVLQTCACCWVTGITTGRTTDWIQSNSRPRKACTRHIFGLFTNRYSFWSAWPSQSLVATSIYVLLCFPDDTLVLG